MEAKEQDKRWYLIRNDNGEWISDDNVVFLTKTEARSLLIKARLMNKEISIQHGCEGEIWCYKQQLKKIMNKRTDDFDKLNNKLKSLGYTSRMPSTYQYKLDECKKILTLTVSRQGLRANMQDDEGAFESWAIVLKYYLRKSLDKIIIDWEEPSNNPHRNVHFNRFVYRLSKFIQTYDWALAAKSIPDIPPVLVCNVPGREAAAIDKHKEGSEGWLECKYVELYKNNYDVMNHRLPVGIFSGEVSKQNRFTAGQKSAIDIWGIRNDDFYIFELKKPDNNPLGIISELTFYTNVIQDILSHRIQYPDKDDENLKKALKHNFRGFKELYQCYMDGHIKNINAIMLADATHSSITPELIDFMNDSERLRSCGIKFAIQKTNI